VEKQNRWMRERQAEMERVQVMAELHQRNRAGTNGTRPVRFLEIIINRCMFFHIDMHMCMLTHTHTRTHARRHTHTHTHTHTNIHTHMHTHIHTQLQTHITLRSPTASTDALPPATFPATDNCSALRTHTESVSGWTEAVPEHAPKSTA